MSHELLERLRAAIVGADDWYAVERAFTQTVSDAEIDEARGTAYAFGYMLVNASNEESRQRNGVFAPRIEWGEGQCFPARLEEVGDEIKAAWVELFDRLDDHASRSRIGDLLWETRSGAEPHRAGVAACRSYTSLTAAPDWQIMDRVDSAARAIELARQLNQADLLQAAVDASIALVTSELEDFDERRPGVVLRVLGTLIALPATMRPTGLLELLDRARGQYGDDPHIADDLLEFRVTLADDAERTALRREQVENWRAIAHQASGLTRFTFRQRALEVARATGESDLANEIALELEATPREDLELIPISAQVELPGKAIEALVDSYADIADAALALTRFGVEGPPTGIAASVDADVADLAKRFPLQRLISTQVLGAHNSLIFSAETPEQHDRLDRARHEELRIQGFAEVALRILDVIFDAEQPDVGLDALKTLFSNGLLDASTASGLATGVDRYRQGDFHGAALQLVTQLEAALRTVAAKIGIPVTKPPRGGEVGGVITLGAILSKLEGRLNESWRRYLVNLLTEPLGVNLRNRLAHGLLSEALQAEAALLVHAACFVRTLGPGPLTNAVGQVAD